MAIPSKQIGQSAEANILWQISKQLEYLAKVTATTSDVTVINDITNPVITALPLEASTSALQTTGNTKLDSIITNTGNVLTDIQLRATPVPISPRPNTTGTNGTTPFKHISVASTNAKLVKATGGNLYSIIAIGLSSTVRFLKIYNKATAPTVGTDVPIMTIPVPSNTQGAGVAIPFSMGVNFPLGISFAITSGSADNDTGAILAGEVIVNLTFA